MFGLPNGLSDYYTYQSYHMSIVLFFSQQNLKNYNPNLSVEFSVASLRTVTVENRMIALKKVGMGACPE